ncbi:spore coat protein [Paenibacillus sp. CF384]|uniref:spore coat protein n=1 Tax=Paenibacillus sp. CF384 TaxID=1884382 RepID=UPI0008977D72|nr:spore coat protein [Paenibacillus sp. CF384]SDW41962.1 Coat F domain-containing protein [Paenibacillus sp. CF384]
MFQQQGQAQPILSDEDLAYTVLADLKRVVREYATAATESSCQEIRQLFTNLMNSTLQMQGHLYKIMEQNNMYSASSGALRQEIDKQLKQNQQTSQKTQQFLQQLNLGYGGYRNAPVYGQYHPTQPANQSPGPGNSNPYYM